MSTSKPVLLSGIQPSGQLTLGNYIGAIRNWVDLQADYDCIFLLVDLHAITVRQDPAVLRQRCRDFLSLYIACGIDPDKNLLCAQSHVAGHSQLAWILDCYTMVGELNRMTQFKDKSAKHADNINAGLYNYPVLMAADILIYDTQLVPVGNDQKQHLELARDVAQRFNFAHKEEVFRIPEPFIPPVGARIMGLQNPEAKMSKSDDNEGNGIYLLDEPKKIAKKIKRAVTDSGSEVRAADDKPGVTNLLNIMAAVTGRSIEDLEADYGDSGYGRFKGDVADAVVAFMEPMQARYRALQDDPAYLDGILARSAEQANARADQKIRQVYDKLGFLPRA
ncbi:MAG: tryptophan--tRNA ligase [Oceanococcus sp.]|nr:MAG: tryptophan--tRNA ligase [Oceanococcus sp.]